MDIRKERISSETKIKVEELQTAYFQLNKFWDRGQSWLDVKMAMKNFVAKAHPKIAHSYFFASDYFGEILTRYNITTVYDTIYKEDSQYAKLLDFFEQNLEKNLLVYDLFIEAIDVAEKNKDKNIKVELDKLLRLHNRFIDQAYLLYDKCASTNNDAIFDGFADNYVNDLDIIVRKFSEEV